MTYPCRNCIYFDACGDAYRTAPCKGRQTKRQAKPKKYYHMVVEPIGNWPGETDGRKEYISTVQGSAPAGYKCVGVCGYHEKGSNIYE